MESIDLGNDKKSLKDYKKMAETLYEQVKRKDREIDRLKEENAVLAKTAFRAQERADQLEQLRKHDPIKKNEDIKK